MCGQVTLDSARSSLAPSPLLPSPAGVQVVRCHSRPDGAVLTATTSTWPPLMHVPALHHGGPFSCPQPCPLLVHPACVPVLSSQRLSALKGLGAALTEVGQSLFPADSFGRAAPLLTSVFTSAFSHCSPGRQPAGGPYLELSPPFF